MSHSPAFARGQRAEHEVCLFLQSQGFQILATNLRISGIEIDIIAQHQSLVCLVEVRFRQPGAMISAFASVTKTKRKRLKKAALLLWQQHWIHNPTIERVRIDVAAVCWKEGTLQIEMAHAVE
jgi:Holliday junction resolvase-like predicted endonuclease